MEAATKTLIPESNPNPHEAISSFFAGYSVGYTYEYFWHFYKAWVCQPIEQKHYSDEETAVFLDQLKNLVAAAYTLHQANTASMNPQGGDVK